MAQCHLEHDEGPDVGGPVAPYIQTERRPLYKEYAELLMSRGHAYRCFCEKTASDEDTGIFEHADDPCRDMDQAESDRRAEAGEPYVIRQRIPHEGSTTFHDEIFGDITVENSTLDDQVLIKRDGLPTYNFANVVDDHLMGITHVVRGSEYLSSSPKYNLLYEGFGWDILHVIPPAILTGQAAGVAASLSLDAGCAIADVDIPTLQAVLASQNVMIHFDDAWIPEGKKGGETVDIGHI
jgi:glutamyl-tRNA synthetase